MTDLIKRLNRLANNPSIQHRSRQDIREAIAILRVHARQADGKTYSGTPVKVGLTAEEKRDVTNFTEEA